MSAHARMITDDHLHLPALEVSSSCSCHLATSSTVADRDEMIQDEERSAPENCQLTRKALKTGLEIVAAMAVGAALVSVIVLSGTMVILGFCVAFLMMLFIGMPLILASIADVVESH